MPVTLPTLFCTPQDVWDLLSTEGVDLRLDDHNLATGQIIKVSSDTLPGATSISVEALSVPLLRGSELVFEGMAIVPDSSLLLRDTFTDTNGTSLASHTMDEGDGWTVHSGSVEIQSNKAQRVSGSGLATADAEQADVTVEAEVTGYFPSSGNYSIPALVVRCNGLANDFYEWDLDLVTGGGRLLFSRVTAGVYTTISISVRSLTPGQTYTLRLECWGSIIKGYIDNVQVMQADDCTQGTNNTRCGIIFGASGTSTQATVDNFNVSVFSPASSSSNVLTPVRAKLTEAAAVNATTISVVALDSGLSAGAQARDSGVNAATGARLAVATRKGTSRVKLYCNGRYDDSQLVLSGTVCDWATICAAKFLCTRRGQGCPKSIQNDYDEAIEEMRMVQAGQLSLEDIGTRGADWPTVTNVIVNPAYSGMRARVQTNISEQTPTNYSRFVDWNSALLLGL